MNLEFHVRSRSRIELTMASTSSFLTSASKVASMRSVFFASCAYLGLVRCSTPSGSSVAAIEDRLVSGDLGSKLRLTIKIGIPFKVGIALPRTCQTPRGSKYLEQKEAPENNSHGDQRPHRPRNRHFRLEGVESLSGEEDTGVRYKQADDQKETREAVYLAMRNKTNKHHIP